MAYHTAKSLPKGVYHNLEAIYEELNRQYFSGNIDAKIAWGKHAPTSSRRRSIKLGSYCYDRKHIVIHPALDQACVPRVCIERVIHHEMLHQYYPARQSRGRRRCVHHAEFRAAEKLFSEAELADRWFKDNLNRLLHP